jgi:hypothetical protein
MFVIGTSTASKDEINEACLKVSDSLCFESSPHLAEICVYKDANEMLNKHRYFDQQTKMNLVNKTKDTYLFLWVEDWDDAISQSSDWVSKTKLNMIIFIYVLPNSTSMQTFIKCAHKDSHTRINNQKLGGGVTKVVWYKRRYKPVFRDVLFL